MLQRKMTAQLEAWKGRDTKKALLLLGARQTGKTFTVREFARANYPTYIEVNFLEDEENGRFLAGAKSAEELLSRLSLITAQPIAPNTLIFFDEVQHLGREIVTLSKFLIEDGRFDLILSGSLLGTVLHGVASFPVGYAHILRMFPLDFEEFCWAMGVSPLLIDQIRNNYLQKIPVEETLHQRLISLFRQYIVIGGMPEAIQDFLDHQRELGVARQVDTEIVEQYRYDIIKYSEEEKLKILDIFDNIPGQLAKVNKRFEMKAVKGKGVFEPLKSSFTWLTNAGVALPAYLITDPKRPLLRTKDKKKFKLYSSDCGILLSQYPIASSRDIVSGEGDANFGAVYENIVAQQLASMGYPLFYYNNNRKGEVDFLIETHEGAILPIEVKSGKDYKRHMALNNLLGSPEYDIDLAYVFSEFNVFERIYEGKTIYYLPLYMSMFLEEEQGDNLEGFFLDEISFDD